jgi:hypothetical protein
MHNMVTKYSLQYERGLVRKITNSYRQVSPALLLHVSAGYCQRAVVGESETVINQTGKHQHTTNGRSVWDALCDTTPQ